MSEKNSNNQGPHLKDEGFLFVALRMKYVIFFFGLVFLSGCAEVQNFVGIAPTKDYYGSLERHDEEDYAAHFEYLGKEYLDSRGQGEIIDLSQKNHQYLSEIYQRLLNNNEILLAKFSEKLDSPEFYVIQNDVPFYFSVPGPKFFFSSGLLKRYIKNEEMLVAVLSFETIKSVRRIYKKKILVPTGHIGTDRMLATTRIPLDMKMEVHKWAYNIMKRAGYDASAYLNWLQTQNKNTVDFLLQVGDTRIMSREEFLFKNFIASKGGFEETTQNISNSSAEFYDLQKEIKRETL